MIWLKLSWLSKSSISDSVRPGEFIGGDRMGRLSLRMWVGGDMAISPMSEREREWPSVLRVFELVCSEGVSCRESGLGASVDEMQSSASGSDVSASR